MKILNHGFDFIEFAVSDLSKHARMYEQMGFERVGERNSSKRGTRSALYAQGFSRILLTEPVAGTRNQESDFLKKHKDGVCVLGLEVEDATQAYQECVGRGARSALEPQRYESEKGTVVRAEIWTPGDFRWAFIERKSSKDRSAPALFDHDFTVSRLESPSPYKIKVIDHLTHNVGMGELKLWRDWYEKFFGFVVTRHFDIRTGKTGLTSDVVQSPDGRIKVPLNEATEKASQVQEFVDRFEGVGVQHLAFLTSDILHTVEGYSKGNVFKFLDVPHTYYETVPTRVPGVTESLKELEDLQVLLDGDEKGYLLQIFSQEVVGPFFFEFIQRKGNQGFGEGNFRALFEAIERDQIRRGTLKA